MYRFLFAFVVLAAVGRAHAAPCADLDVPCLTAKLRAAKAHARQDKAHARLAKAAQAAWIADCIASWHTPDASHAREICMAEAPTLDELRTDPTAAPRRRQPEGH